MRVPRAPVILATALLFAAAGGALAGCGSSASDQVRAKVDQFATAASHRDYRTICEQVLAPGLLDRLSANGVPCEEAMKVGLGKVQDPTISISKVIVNGSAASAIALSGARGQTASLESIELTRTDSGWRISSLASPLSTKPNSGTCLHALKAAC